MKTGILVLRESQQAMRKQLNKHGGKELYFCLFHLKNQALKQEGKFFEERRCLSNNLPTLFFFCLFIRTCT